MIYEKNPLSTTAVSFGPFKLTIAAKRLEHLGNVVHLSSRAFEILTILVERAGEAVSKKELIARVWSDVTVDEGSLRVQVAALRKAIGDGQRGARYIATLPSRGYCFVSPISYSSTDELTPTESPIPERPSYLPSSLARMVGRDATVRELAAQLKALRFLTIVGPGGIGKTTVAVSIAHALLAEFKNAVCFLDLSSLTDPGLVASTAASAVGIVVQSGDPVNVLVTVLRDKRLLLVLDNCEHVVETVAALAERVFIEAPDVHILATSRESLRVKGEHVFNLPSLECPPDDRRLTAEEAWTFPAAQLFVERVLASGSAFEFGDRDAETVGEICRKLDGISLAIELAAGSVSTHGLKEIASLLDSRLRLHWKGRRTAPFRHQTLSATLDWSYELLSETERLVLQRLSIFAGVFSLEAAKFVASGDGLSEANVIAIVGKLVAKSLLSARADRSVTRYRLLETTKSYVMERVAEIGEVNAISRKHAQYYISSLQLTHATTAGARGFSLFGEHLANIRSALEWSFSQNGDARVGFNLSALSASLFLELSLLTECHRWTQLALDSLDDQTRDTRWEFELQASFGLSFMFTKGNTQGAEIALKRALELAERFGDLPTRVQLLGRLQIFYERTGDFHRALEYAQFGMAAATEIGDPVGVAEAQAALGISRHAAGNNRQARTHLQAALSELPISSPFNIFKLGFNYRNRAQAALARTLWVEGFSDQGVSLAQKTVEEAATFDHPVTLCIALAWATYILLWNGDFSIAEKYIERLSTESNRHSLAPFQAVAEGKRGELFVRRGDNVRAGILLLSESLETLHRHRYEANASTFRAAMAEGLVATGRFDEALETINQGISSVEQNGDYFLMPEIFRIRGTIFAARSPLNLVHAEESFRESLKLAGSQYALAWELKAATNLAEILCTQHRFEEAKDVLTGVYDRFTEGFQSRALKAARELLDTVKRF
jgi:predicted ATPase/DNA-binding winged helix-turn-helix (wHTH) protein